MYETAHRSALAAAKRGWRVLIVGGYVRDTIARRKPDDIDLEVYGDFTAAELQAFLEGFDPNVSAVGASFGVFKLTVDGVDIDVSVPRRENKAGRGHKGFIVEPDPTMTPEEAASRRDFTMNAMALDPLTGELIDPFGGADDIKANRLRHTSDKFTEDPLRVLRGMQFCGRFVLVVARETRALCYSLKSEYNALSKERIWGEWRKWAEKSEMPSFGLDFLAETWLELYPELFEIVTLAQNPEYHPEGDVWEHTLFTVDAMAEICDRDGIAGEDRVVLVLAALCHDLGKASTTEWNEEKGKITSYNHDTAGEAPTRSFLNRIGAPKHIVERIVPLVTCHMRHVNYYTGGEVTERHVRRLARDLAPATIREWAAVVEADHNGRPPLPGGLPEAAQRMLGLAEELAVQDAAPKPILMGRHLIELGMSPGPEFGDILEAAYEAQLDGAFSTIEGAIEWLIRLEKEEA